MQASLTRAVLDAQSDRIEQVLAAHRVAARVDGGTVSPRWVRFHLTPAGGARLTGVHGLSEALAVALGAPEVRVADEGEALAVEVVRADAEPVRLLPLLQGLGALPALTACLGLAEDGRPLLIRLPSADVAHVLVAGAAGSGKTELMRALLASLALGNRQSRLQLALIDLQGQGLGPLAALPHALDGIAADPDSARQLLARLVHEMERRGRENVSEPHIVVAVDELDPLLQSGGEQVETALVRLTQRGREAGLHLVAGVQTPSAGALGGRLAANFPVRLVGRAADADEARLAAGQAGSGAEQLQGSGDFLAMAAGQAIRFQAAWIPALDWDSLVRQF